MVALTTTSLQSMRLQLLRLVYEYGNTRTKKETRYYPQNEEDKKNLKIILTKVATLDVSPQSIIDALTCCNDSHSMHLMFALLQLWKNNIDISLLSFKNEQTLVYTITTTYQKILTQDFFDDFSMNEAERLLLVTSYTNVYTYMYELFKNLIDPNEKIDDHGNTYPLMITKAALHKTHVTPICADVNRMLIHFLKLFHHQIDPSIQDNNGKNIFDICKNHYDGDKESQCNKKLLLATLNTYVALKPKFSPKSIDCFFRYSSERYL